MNFRIKLRSELVKRHDLVLEVPPCMKQSGKRLGQRLLLRNPEPPMVSWTCQFGVWEWDSQAEEEDTWDPGQKIKSSLVTVKKMDSFEVMVIAQLLESGQGRRTSTSQVSGETATTGFRFINVSCVFHGSHSLECWEHGRSAYRDVRKCSCLLSFLMHTK